MISEAPGTFSPLEIARNRLAKALFFLCITIIVLTVTVDRSANEFAAIEQNLSSRVSELDRVRGRLLTFIDPDADYFSSRLQSAFDVICLTPEEAEKPQIKPGSQLLFLTSSTVSDLVKKQLSRSMCEPQFLTVHVDQSNTRNISAHLADHLREKQLSPKAAIGELGDSVTGRDKELWNLLLAYWGEAGLNSLISQRWMDWRSMRGWVLYGREPYWISTARETRRMNYGSGYGNIYTSNYYVGSSLGELYSRFDKATEAVRTASQDLALIAIAADGRQALLELEIRLKEAVLELKTHSPELKWSAVGFGGISISVLQWLEWMPWLVVALQALFMSFDQKANRTEGIGTSDFWFPRLGRPLDPLAPPMPPADQWGASAFWFFFAALPLVICYWGAVMRFQILGWGSIGITAVRDFKTHPADWFNSVALIACLGLTIHSTNSKNEFQSQNYRVVKLVVWVCCIAAVCTALIVSIDQFFLRTDYRGNSYPMLWDGQLYLIFLSIAIAAMAVGSMKRLSRFGTFALFSLSITNYIFVVRTTLM